LSAHLANRSIAGWGPILLFALTAWAADEVPYVLGPEDQITIRALDAEEISDKPFTIDTSGYVNLPLLGQIQAAGLTVPKLEAAIAAKLKEFVWDPRVAVTVSEFRSQPVSVIGAVNTPGVQQLRGRKTLIEVLSGAGGLRPDAGYKVTIQRKLERGLIPLPGAKTDPTGQFSLAQVSMPSIMANLHPEENILMRPNDVISVPRADLVYVVGEVKKAGGFPLDEREALSVLKAVALSEGLLATASPTGARILRGGQDASEREEIPVDLKRVLSGKSEDLLLKPNDILFVPSSATKKVGIRAIEAAIQLGTGVVIWRH
jgi:polysaccharide export outer membrane protein